jgi:alkaline phosphatase D
MANKPSFKNLKAHVPLIATWDDHDYGRNDAGKYFSAKQQSKQAFLSFFDEPQNSERRNREGIYQSYYYPVNGKMVQVILLDVRWFRDNLLKYKGEKRFNPCYMYRKYYSAYKTADSTFLGDAQWQWLEQELRKPADVRIIGSGSQFGITWNGYESWANFPHERKRMLELIKTTQAKGVVFISGDVHYAEVSKINYQGLYPIYDVTASGLSSTWEFATPNKNRVAGPVMQNHFGLITINWADEKPYLLMEIWDKYNKKCVSIKELLFNLN